MSSRQWARERPILEFNPNVLTSEEYLVGEIERILGLNKRDAEFFIGKTSGTAYRRVHEIVASVLDRFSSSIPGDPSLLTELARGLILVRYQASRGQVSESLANYLDNMLRTIIDKAKSTIEKARSSREEVMKQWEDVKRLARNARSILDALAVLVYQYT